jgi:thiamine biosynthesis lipoprotein
MKMDKNAKVAMLLLLLISLISCALAPPESEFVLGTVCTVNLYEKGSAGLYRKVFERLRELEDIFSANRDDSELAGVNRNAGVGAVVVSNELLEVLEKALVYAGLSTGAFDPTVGPLVELWGIGGDGPRVPLDDEIQEALALVDWRDVEIDQLNRAVFLKSAGMKLDLGAIAKGYAADEVVRLIAGAGVKRAVIDLGGNIFAYGEKKDKKPWRVGLQDPREGRGEYIGILDVKNKTVVTSGIYERYFEEGGRRYHHILSTGTGYPVENGLLSVTIVAGHSVDADALSTSVFALGYERGNALIKSLPGVEAVFVFEDLTVRLTEGITGEFSLTNENYRLTN